MGIEFTPETNIARRIVDKYSLSPPVDIKSMVESHARLTFVPIPFDGIDGISLNLKTIGRSTHVIVNSMIASARQRFTMAHELGHILIPWHVGSVLIDQVAPESPQRSSYFTPDSWTMETEANAFAAELLMPYSWINRQLSTTGDLSRIHRDISVSCRTSALSAAIRLSQFLPKRIVYAAERDGLVEFSGTTEGTIASPLGKGSAFPMNPFAYSDQHYVSSMHQRRLHWWRLPEHIHIDVSDDRTWRNILDHILQDIGLGTQEIARMKMSISGVVGSANNRCKNKHCVSEIVSSCVQRLSDRNRYRDLVGHRDFYAFIQKRAMDIANRNEA